MTLLEALRKIKPSEHYIIAAMGTFKDEAEIKQFYKEYVDLVRGDESERIRSNAESIAKRDIGYALGYFGKETANIWEKALQISHPILGELGENIPLSPEDAIKKGTELRNERCYIK